MERMQRSGGPRLSISIRRIHVFCVETQAVWLEHDTDPLLGLSILGAGVDSTVYISFQNLEHAPTTTSGCYIKYNVCKLARVQYQRAALGSDTATSGPTAPSSERAKCMPDAAQLKERSTATARF